MDWKEGTEIMFRTDGWNGNPVVYRATVGDGDRHRYIFLPEERLAFKVHSVKCVRQWWVKKELLESGIELPPAIFVTYNIAKSVNARRNGNQDCDRKGCFDRYDCIWYNTAAEKKPWNRIPKNHVPGEERCPRCVLRQHLNEKGKPKAEKEETVWARWSRAKDEETDRALDILMPMLNHILFDDDATQKDIDDLRAEITRLLM